MRRYMPKYRGRHRLDGQITIFVRPHPVREVDKKVIDKEMK